MKISRLECVAVVVCAVFLAFCAGWFLRGSVVAQPLVVETERVLREREATVVSAPASVERLEPPTAPPFDQPLEQPSEPEQATASPVQTQGLPAATPEATKAATPATASGGRININTASAAELDTLPGIGEKRAADIIAYRTAKGPFRYPEDLTAVKGIGAATLAGLLDYITTGEESP